MGDTCALEVVSGVSYLSEEIQTQLSGMEWPKAAPRLIFLDRPIGWVLLSAQFPKLKGAIVATDNKCPEYRRELVCAEPHIVVLGVTAQLIRSSLYSGFVIEPPTTVLSPTEGKILKLVAEGNSNKKTALYRNTSEGVIENALHSIYQKLSLKTRVDLVHYFYYNWHLLDEQYYQRVAR